MGEGSRSYLPCKAVSGCPSMDLTTKRHPRAESNMMTIAVVLHKTSVFQF